MPRGFCFFSLDGVGLDPSLQVQSRSVAFGQGPPLQGDFVRRVVPRPAPTRGRGTSMYRSDEIPLQRRPSRRGVFRFGGHCLRPVGAGIDEATDTQLAKDAVVRESGDAHDPRTTAAPPEASQHRRFSTWPDLASLQPGEEPGFDPAAAQIRAAPQHHTSAGRRDDSGIV